MSKYIKENKMNLIAFLSVLVGVIIIALLYIQIKGLEFSFDRIVRTMIGTGVIIAIIAAIPGSLSAPAGADEVAAQARTSIYSNKPFNLKTAQTNLKSYNNYGGWPMLITYSGFIIAFISFLLTI